MAREIPEVVRAAAGLAATVLDEARKLPETLPGLPVRVIGLAMQSAMKVQQHYAGLVARGDELFTGLRGENEPGLATFDDDEPLPETTGFRDSAFDRASDTAPTADLITDEEVPALPSDPAADAVTRVVDGLAGQVEDAELTIEELADAVPGTDEILDEIAIDELVDQAPTLEETAPTSAPAATAKKAAKKAAKAPAKAAKATRPRKSAPAPAATDGGTADAAATLDAEPTADVATTVDVLTPDGDVATVDAAVTDEGVAAPESPADAEPAPPAEAPVSQADADGSSTATATATDESGTPVAAATGTPSTAPSTPPIDGYDSFSVAQLRGRLRGYALSTVEELISYEQATRARAPYLTMLRNRLEKLEEQAIESSPLAPRGA